jgi:hypothetical protein
MAKIKKAIEKTPKSKLDRHWAHNKKLPDVMTVEDEVANIKRVDPIDMGERGKVTGAKKGKIPIGAKTEVARRKDLHGAFPGRYPDVLAEPSDAEAAMYSRPDEEGYEYAPTTDPYEAAKRKAFGNIGKGRIAPVRKK